MTFKRLPKRHSSKEMIKVKGAEETLLEFKVKVRKFDLFSDKKLSSIKRIIKRNDWIKMRALMGANYRADVTFL